MPTMALIYKHEVKLTPTTVDRRYQQIEKKATWYELHLLFESTEKAIEVYREPRYEHKGNVFYPTEVVGNVVIFNSYDYGDNTELDEEVNNQTFEFEEKFWNKMVESLL